MRPCGRQTGAPGQCAHDVPRVAAPRAPAKQKTLHARARDTPRVQQARAASQAMMAPRAVARDKFVDESGINRAMPRW